MRFYPESFPAFDYEPTRDRFEIRRIGDSVGEGVVSLASFEPGEIVFAFTGVFSSVITQYTLQVTDKLHLHDPYFMGKILHCCDPNCSVDMQTRLFTCVKPIHPGDFVTMDYAQTEARLFKPFPCECGAANCRGVVRGYLEDTDASGLHVARLAS